MFEINQLNEMPLAQLDERISWCVQESETFARQPLDQAAIDGIDFYDRKAALYLSVLLDRVTAGEDLP